MEVIATDSYRLAKKTISLSEKNDKDVGRGQQFCYVADADWTCSCVRVIDNLA